MKIVRAKFPEYMIEQIPHDIVEDFAEVYLEYGFFLHANVDNPDPAFAIEALYKINSILKYFGSKKFVVGFDWDEHAQELLYVMEE